MLVTLACAKSTRWTATTHQGVGQAQLAADQSNCDQNQAREKRREMRGQPGTGMRQGGGGDPELDTYKEKNEAVAKQSATLRLKHARHGHIPFRGRRVRMPRR
jgi:hypothetical protein